MEEKPKNSIRPVTIRIVNPTPKTADMAQTGEEKTKQSGIMKQQVSFLFYLLLGLLLFCLLSYFGFIDRFRTGNPWRTFIIQALLFLTLTFILPLFSYFLLHPQKLKSLTFRFDALSGILGLVMAFPFAYMLSLLNIFLSLLLVKAGFLKQVWTSAKFTSAFSLNRPIQMIFYIVIFCILAALIYEFSLRPVLLLHIVANPLKEATSSNHVFPILGNALLTALLIFDASSFLPYFLFGLVAAHLFLKHKNIISSLLLHFGFALAYQVLIPTLAWLRVNTSATSYRQLADYLPLASRFLIAATIFVPMLIILEQFHKQNMLLMPAASSNSNNRQTARHQTKQILFIPAFIGIIILYVLMVFTPYL